MQKHHRLVTHIAAAFLACAMLPAAAAQDTKQYESAVAHKAREADRKDDAKRKPAEFLAFAQVRPGMQVLDVASGAGSTAQLLALAVGDKGTVYAQNSKEVEKLKQRTTATSNLKPVVASFDNPVPAGTPPLDLVTINMSYHDIVNRGADRAAMNKALYQALKPGGKLVVIDNAAKAGAGTSVANTLHRMEEATVIEEVTAAGFTVDGRSDYLHVPTDPRDKPFFEMKGEPDDKFAIRFIKK